MKKILVVGLAAAMMTSTAFANTLTQLKPGDQIIFTMSDFVDQNKLYAGAAGVATADNYKISTTGSANEITFYTSGKSGNLTPNQLGATWDDNNLGNAGTNLTNSFGLNVGGSGSMQDKLAAAKKSVYMLARQDIQTYDFTATNFTVTVNAPVGRNFIKNYEFDGAGNLIVNLKGSDNIYYERFCGSERSVCC